MTATKVSPPASHERHKLLCIADSVKLDELTMCGLNLLATDGGEESDAFRVDGRLLGCHDTLVDGVQAFNASDQLIWDSDVITVLCIDGCG